jgi:hypothetical protein
VERESCHCHTRGAPHTTTDRERSRNATFLDRYYSRPSM